MAILLIIIHIRIYQSNCFYFYFKRKKKLFEFRTRKMTEIDSIDSEEMEVEVDVNYSEFDWKIQLPWQSLKFLPVLFKLEMIRRNLKFSFIIWIYQKASRLIDSFLFRSVLLYPDVYFPHFPTSFNAFYRLLFFLHFYRAFCEKRCKTKQKCCQNVINAA